MEDRNDNKVIELKSALGDADETYHSKFGNYKPDDELLQSTTRIKNQRDVILERIHKMETSQSRVSSGVFDKVQRDYGLQLQTISELLDEKKASLKKEIKDLYIRREKLTVEINRHKEILEEAEFRHFLGEFSQSQFQEVQNYESKEIEKLQGDLSRISQYIRMHEDLFDPEDLGQKKTQEPGDVTQTVQTAAPQTTQAAPQPTKEQAQAPVTNPAVTPTQPATTPSPSNVEQASVTESTAASTPVAATQPTPAATPQPPAAEPTPEGLSQTSADIDANEFEALFDDDDADESKKARLAESQSNIKQLIDEPEESVSDIIPEPEKNEDYFNQESVSESSFTVKKEDLGSEENTPPAQKLKDIQGEDEKQTSDPAEIKTDIRVEADEPKVTDDSISDILDSINLEESESAPVEAPKESEMAADISLDMDSNNAQDYVLTLVEGELDMKELQLKDNISIGRSSANDLVLKAPKVSRQHAAINMYNNQFIIIDLKSSNGVYVNGAKIDEAVLNLGDEISVGGYRFKFEKK